MVDSSTRRGRAGAGPAEDDDGKPGPPKGEVCPPPTPAPVKAYSYNFETMQPTNSPTPQG